LATAHTDRAYGPAQLFCVVVGSVLVLAGIIGFFYNSTFTSDTSVRDDVFGILSVNGWHNVVHIATGALTLAFARTALGARNWCLAFGAVYLVVAIWGFVLGGDNPSILSIVPVNTADDVLHLLLGLGGIGIYAATGAERRSAHPATA
jgi:uncharacterized protein DUF4383